MPTVGMKTNTLGNASWPLGSVTVPAMEPVWLTSHGGMTTPPPVPPSDVAVPPPAPPAATNTMLASGRLAAGRAAQTPSTQARPKQSSALTHSGAGAQRHAAPVTTPTMTTSARTPRSLPQPHLARVSLAFSMRHETRRHSLPAGPANVLPLVRARVHGRVVGPARGAVRRRFWNVDADQPPNATAPRSTHAGPVFSCRCCTA